MSDKIKVRIELRRLSALDEEDEPPVGEEGKGKALEKKMKLYITQVQDLIYKNDYVIGKAKAAMEK